LGEIKTGQRRRGRVVAVEVQARLLERDEKTYLPDRDGKEEGG
jgi:hypothetical protein